MSGAMPRRALFLDRDGVINVNTGYVHTPEQTKWVPGIFEFCRMAADLGYVLVVITNQAGIARGYYGEPEFARYSEWMRDQFTARGLRIEAIYHCPHHPTEGFGELRRECDCRKPQPGMIQRAQRELGLDLASSALLGDMDSDVEAGRRAGVAHCLKLGTEEFANGSAMTNAMAWLRAIGPGNTEPARMDASQIRDWFHKPRTSKLARDRVMELYFTFHPRTAFLKTLALGSSVVDVGAGDGSLSVFLGWPAPERNDLGLHAYSLEKGAMFDKFKSYEIGDWNQAQPEFQGQKFDAVVCAHFIEHIADPASFVAWAARKLNRGGRLYVEWPSPASLELPSRAELEAIGVNLMISRFNDDDTHRDLPDADVISAVFVALGFSIECRGIVRLPWIEDEMLAHFKDDADGFPRQAAFWSRTGWSQYLILRLGD